MDTLWGLALVVATGILGWGGQIINATAPRLAMKWGLNEREEDVDPVFFADSRGEAIWDALCLWPLPVAGVLLLLKNPWWAYFGLAGGGMYVYFAGRAIVVRIVLRRRGIRVAKPELLKVYCFLLALWGAIGAVTIVLAARVLGAV